MTGRIVADMLQRVKIRGYRIELCEIEAAMLRHHDRHNVPRRTDHVMVAGRDFTEPKVTLPIEWHVTSPDAS